ncbi:MAG: hypothetical protein ACLGI9_21380 [Thermoanaerobaculia bacterium]
MPGGELRIEKTAQLTCFPELPPGAEAALAAIQKAAEARDMTALRAWLAPGVEVRPEMLKKLAATLDQGCLEDESGQRVVCPPAYQRNPRYKGSRAAIERRTQGWRLTMFKPGK